MTTEFHKQFFLLTISLMTKKNKFCLTIYLLTIFAIMASCKNEDTGNKFLEYFKVRASRITFQNENAKDNLDHLYSQFDKAKIIDPVNFRPDWNKAFELKKASEILISEIDTLKNSLDEMPSMTPRQLKDKIAEFESLILSLPDSINPNSIKITLDMTGYKSETEWHPKNEIVLIDLAIFQNSIINAETAILTVLYLNLREKEGKFKKP